MKQVLGRELVVILREAGLVLDSGVVGDFVEMGCYKGETSVELGKLLRESGRRLWLYDSFAGLPAKGREDLSAGGEEFREGELLATKTEVLRRFRGIGIPMPVVKKAWFAELADSDLPERIAFAFLDGDYYESILDSLRLIVPKMVAGGVIVVHDYASSALPGVAKAVDGFLCGKKNDVVVRSEAGLGILKF
jgi:O-methyltransferase